MKDRLLLISTLIVGVCSLILSGLLLNWSGEKVKLLGVRAEVMSVDLIGTSTASSTLTGEYTNNRAYVSSQGFDNLHLDLDYMPYSSTSTAKFTEILVEGSNDSGTTYFPLGLKSVGSTEIDLFVEGSRPDSRYTAPGVPIIIPGDKTSNSTTSYRGSIDFDVLFNRVRVSARESASGTGQFGKLYIRGTLSQKAAQ